MGRGAFKDLGKLGLNALATPFEALTGQNLYQPDVQGSVAKGMAKTQDITGQLGGAILPSVANMALPGSGSAINAARGMMPNITPQAQQQQNFQQPQMNMGQQAYQQMGQEQQGGNALYPFGGQLPYNPSGQTSGPNLNTFNGPSHDNGGMQLNGQAEIEKQETVDPNAKYVYSDRLKVPGSKKTFAEESKKFKGSDKDDDITKNTNKLMLDRLKNNQEELKKLDFEKASAKFEKKYGGYLQQQMAQGGYYTPAEAASAGATLTQAGTAYGSNAGNYGGGATQYPTGGQYGDNGLSDAQMNDMGGDSYTNYNYANHVVANQKGLSSYTMVADPMQQAIAPTQMSMPGPYAGAYKNESAPYLFGSETPAGSLDNYAGSFNQQGQVQSPQGQGQNFGDFVNQIGTMAPIAYNLAQGQAPIDYYQAEQNPQYQKSIDLASDMRYNADPQLAEARRTFNQTKSAIQDFSGGNSAVALANLHGAQIQADRSKQGVLANKDNMDNQYRAQEAQIRGNLGQQYANEASKAQIYKLQAEANRRKHTGQAMEDVGKSSQVNQQMANESSKDAALQEMLKSHYGQYGNFDKLLANFDTKSKTKKK